MGFQTSILGPLWGKIQPYSDLDGLVPENGDEWRQFHWDRRMRRHFDDHDQGSQHWSHFVAQAQDATLSAERDLLRLEGWD